jgi:fermentation-respiration switch protein FrsA (DUF1100 family)
MSESTTPSQPSLRSRRSGILFVIRTVAVLSASLIILIPCGLGFFLLVALTAPACSADADPRARGIDREDIRFPSSEFDADYLGYFIPGTASGTVIVLPTHRSGRGDRMSEIAIYHAAGYNVLTYRSRSCLGETDTLGYAEVTAVGDALRYLRSRPSVDMTRVVLHGFSAGGAASLMAFARYPEVSTVVAMGGYHNFSESLYQDVGQIGILRGLLDFGARFGYRLMSGHDVSVLDPLEAVRRSAPRPILLIYGGVEMSLEGARLMQAVDPERVALWIVPTADHGDYVAVAGADVFRQRVIGFLSSVFDN